MAESNIEQTYEMEKNQKEKNSTGKPTTEEMIGILHELQQKQKKVEECGEEIFFHGMDEWTAENLPEKRKQSLEQRWPVYKNTISALRESGQSDEEIEEWLEFLG